MTGWNRLPTAAALLVALSVGARAQAGDPLLSADPRIREDAVRRLGRQARTDLAPTLERALADPVASVRTAALSALGQLPEGPALAPLLGALSDESPAVRRAAVELIGRTHATQAVVPLLLALEDSSGEVRAAAVQAIARTDDSRSEEALVRSLQDRVHEVRRAALRALGRVGAGAVSVALQELMQGPAALREEAIGTLGLLGARFGEASIAEALIARLSDSAEADAAMQALVRMGKPAVPVLLRALGRGVMPTAVVEALGRIGDRRAALVLVKEVNKGRVEPARLARALGSMGDHAVEPSLLALLEDEAPLARCEALDALAPSVDPVVVAAVMRAASDRSPAVRACSLAAIGRLGIRQGLPALRKALRQADPALAETAANAIGRLSDGDSVRALVDAMAAWGGRATQGLRRALPAALAASCDGACARGLLAFVSLGDDWVSVGTLRALAYSLRVHPFARAVGPLLDQAEGRHEGRAEAALAALDALAAAQAASRLTRLVGDPRRPIVRRWLATQALGGLLGTGARVPSAEQVLCQALTERDAGLRAEAAWSLRYSTSRAAEAALVTALADREGAVRGNALGALAARGTTIPTDRLIRLLRDPEPAVRANAARLLDPVVSRARLERLAEDDPDPMVRAGARQRAMNASGTTSGRAAFDAILIDPDGVPLSGAMYRLQRPDGVVRCGHTDGGGSLHEERLPPGGVHIRVP